MSIFVTPAVRALSLLDLCQIYNFCKKPKALMASVTELRVLEHLKHHGEYGDAERVLPPDPVANQGQYQ